MDELGYEPYLTIPPLICTYPCLPLPAWFEIRSSWLSIKQNSELGRRSYRTDTGITMHGTSTVHRYSHCEAVSIPGLAIKQGHVNVGLCLLIFADFVLEFFRLEVRQFYTPRQGKAT